MDPTAQVKRARAAINQAVADATQAGVPVDVLLGVMLMAGVERLENQHGAYATGALLCNLGSFHLARADIGDCSPGTKVPLHHCHIAGMRHSLNQLVGVCPVSDLRNFLQSCLLDLASPGDGGRA